MLTVCRPAGFYQGVLPVTEQYWYDSYGNIRFPYGSSKQSNTVELIHDAFQPLSYWNGKMTVDKGFQGVAMDTHIYQMFSNEVRYKMDGFGSVLMECMLPASCLFQLQAYFNGMRSRTRPLYLRLMDHCRRMDTGCY